MKILILSDLHQEYGSLYKASALIDVTAKARPCFFSVRGGLL